MITRAQYSRKKTLSIERAIPAALCRYMLDRQFPGPGGVGMIQFADAFPEWAEYEDKAVGPALSVIQVGRLTYASTPMTPTLLEETWEPEGFPGLGLYLRGTVEVTFKLNVRAQTPMERSALISGIQELFVAPDTLDPAGEPGILMNSVQGSREGVLLELCEYYGMPARLSLIDSGNADSEDSNIRDRIEGDVLVQAQTNFVSLGKVQPFTVSIVQIFT